MRFLRLGMENFILFAQKAKENLKLPFKWTTRLNKSFGFPFPNQWLHSHPNNRSLINYPSQQGLATHYQTIKSCKTQKNRCYCPGSAIFIQATAKILFSLIFFIVKCVFVGLKVWVGVGVFCGEKKEEKIYYSNDIKYFSGFFLFYSPFAPFSGKQEGERINAFFEGAKPERL